MLKKFEIVTHFKWGQGIVVADECSGQVVVEFSEGRKSLLTQYAGLQIVKRESREYRAGDLVRHPLRSDWGIGRITLVSPPNYSRPYVLVAFSNKDARRVETRFVRLPRVNESGVDVEEEAKHLLFELMFSKSPCRFCGGKAMLVISRDGGFISADCIECGKANIVRLGDLPSRSCPRCSGDTIACHNNKNYAYRCNNCYIERFAAGSAKTLCFSYSGAESIYERHETHKTGDAHENSRDDKNRVQSPILWDVQFFVPCWSTFFDYDGPAIPLSSQEWLRRFEIT